MGQFSDVIKDSTKPKSKREFSTGSDFVKLSLDHTTMIRILDSTPVVSWSHFVPRKHSAFPNANAGKGMSFICPGMSVCSICEWNKKQVAALKGEKPKNLLNSRRVYTFNVLDRTPVLACSNCGLEHYEKNRSDFPDECSDCGTSLANAEAGPRNKIQIFQKGITITKQFITFEEEFGDISSYDIKLDTRVDGEQVSTICVPMPPTELKLDELVGEDWQEKLYNIKEIIKPMDTDKMDRILGGEDFYTVVKGT